MAISVFFSLSVHSFDTIELTFDTMILLNFNYLLEFAMQVANKVQYCTHNSAVMLKLLKKIFSDLEWWTLPVSRDWEGSWQLGLSLLSQGKSWTNWEGLACPHGWLFSWLSEDWSTLVLLFAQWLLFDLFCVRALRKLQSRGMLGSFSFSKWF